MELIFEKSHKGAKGYKLPKLDVKEEEVPSKFKRKKEAQLPEVSEPEVVRHFTNLSSLNYHIEKNMYPLGSCTMKYNPKVSEFLVSHPKIAELHPLQPEETLQGGLKLLYELGEYLKEISGMDEISLLPVAGAHAELVAMLMIKKYFENKKEKRTKVIVPDSAHGTNPASSSFAGLEVVEVKSNEEGILDVENVKKVVGKDVACLMLTIPNTLGLFEKNILKITKIAKDEGIILYLDGANLNAFVGIVKPKEMGIDIVHFNLHKTFGTPHGTGGPGGGGIGVVSFLKEYLPIPRIKKEKEKYTLKYNFPNSIGVVHSFYGNFSVSVRAYFYLRMLGGEGLEEVAYNSVLNANYLMQKLKNHFYIPYSTFCMHEFVISCEPQVKNYGVRALDIAKRLLDYGFHPPTIYFPLIVKEALMVEPTETEDLTTLDNFVSALLHILSECKHSPNIVKQAPHCMPVKRLDEVYAAKMLKVNYYEDD